MLDIWESTDKIKPASIFFYETAEKFENTIAKARMLYEHVELHPDFQVALLYNGESWNKVDYMTVYTNWEDRKVYTKQLNCDDKQINFYMDNIWGVMPRLYVKSKELERVNNKVYRRYGVMRIDGSYLTGLHYEKISRFQDVWLLCQRGSDRRGKLCDIDGKVWLQFNNGWGIGNIEIRDVGRVDIVYCAETAKRTKKEIQRKEDIRHYTCYIINRRKLYSLFETRCRGGVQIVPNSDRILVFNQYTRIGPIGEGDLVSTQIAEFRAESLMEYATEVEIGIPPKFHSIKSDLDNGSV